MIRYLKNHEIDTEQWDKCIQADPSRLIYGLSWYLDILAGKNWDALVLGDYEAVWPLCHGKKYGIPYLYRPIGAQQLGIFAAQKLSPELIEDFVRHIPKKFLWKDLYFNVNNPTELITSGTKIKNINIELDLNKPYDELVSQYSSQTKRNLKASQKAQLQQFNYDQIDLLLHLFKNHKGKTLDLPTSYYERMKQIMYVAQHRGYGQLYLIYDETQSPVAGVFTLEFKGRITLIFTATSDYGKEIHAMTYLLNELIAFHSHQDKILDFEGSNIPSLKNFYLGFGGVERAYVQWKKVF